MNISDILFWSFSFILAFISIFVSWVGAVNSSKANEKLTNFLSSTWIEDESKKLFYEQMRRIQTANIKIRTQIAPILANVKNGNQSSISYARYMEMGKRTRLPFVSDKIRYLLTVSKYASILKTYDQEKEHFEAEFRKVVDLSKLHSMEFMNEKEIFILNQYHQALYSFCSVMIEEYIIEAKSATED